MEKDNLIKGMMGILVCVVLLGGLLLPVVSNALVITGDPVTYYNDDGLVYREMKNGDVLKVVNDMSSGIAVDTWFLNGEVIDNINVISWDIALMSDGFYSQVQSPSNAAILAWATSDMTALRYIEDASSGNIKTVSFTLNDGTITLASAVNDEEPNIEATVPVTWAYVLCTVEDGAYYSTSVSTGAGLVNMGVEPIAGGVYTTGELDTYYSYNGGTIDFGQSAMSGSIDNDLTLKDGTTDIYNIETTITVSNGSNTESFNPYKILIPFEVHGHKDSGAAYSMIGVLPIIGIVGVLVAGIYVFLGRKY